MSSLLQISHETIYLYRSAVSFGPHRLVLRPREGHDIHVEEMRLEIEPDFTLQWSRDVFGNSVAKVHFLEPGRQLRIHNQVLLRETAPFPSATVPPNRVPFPANYSAEERTVAAAYQANTFPEDIGVVKQWLADEVDLAGCEDAVDAVSKVNRAVGETISYARRETKGVLPPSATLGERKGSCRDMATLLLEALRVLGLPARFASGYFDCHASEAGHASMHAWAEVYLPEVGWVGFDPTTKEMTSERHVVVGVSNHPRGVMPVTGVFYGDQGQFLEMQVRVKTERVSEHPLSYESAR
jgi:transglutaminase-like putative cysteine protease